MNKVVILGSKPNAIVPRGDKIYCANAGFLSNEDAVATFADRVAVASSMVLGNGLLPDSRNHEVYRQKLDAVRDAGMSRIILFGAPISPDMATKVAAYLQADGQNPNISVISVVERADLVKSIAGTRYPLVDRSFYSQPFRIRMRDHWLNCRSLWDLRFGNGHLDTSPKYRPSTGILALLQAIRENGNTAEYVLAGIGAKARNVVKVKTFTAKLRDTPVGEIPEHVTADLIVLRNLVRRYTLSTTEQELTEVVEGLRLHP